MKCLIIENGKGYFSFDGDAKVLLDQITKDDLLKLLNMIVDDDVAIEMDEYDENTLHHAAHKIIYRTLNQKFKDLHQNKTRFKDESRALYKSSIEKYSAELKNADTPL